MWKERAWPTRAMPYPVPVQGDEVRPLLNVFLHTSSFSRTELGDGLKMWSGSEEGSHFRLIDFCSTLGSRVIKKNNKEKEPCRTPSHSRVTR